jgi:7-carboxy-7-deazaguanine synthase
MDPAVGSAQATPAPRSSIALPVVETFHSLQGEGLHSGRSAFFVRLAGCDVGCPWCDTKPSWPQDSHPRRSLADLVQEATAAAAAGAAFVVITGGEPLQHNLEPLCAALADTGLPLHLETSGAAPLCLSGRFAWITLSPKRHRPPSASLLATCDELKVVVHEPADLAFAAAMAAQALQLRQPPAAGPADSGAAVAAELECEGVAAERATQADRPSNGACPQPPHAAAPHQPAPTGPALLLQPGWNCRRGQELAVAFVRSHPAWRLSLQSHKWLGVR